MAFAKAFRSKTVTESTAKKQPLTQIHSFYLKKSSISQIMSKIIQKDVIQNFP